MGKVVIVFACDNGYVMQTAVAITSVIQNKDLHSVYDIYVIGTGLSQENVELLCSMTKQDVNVTVVQAEVNETLRCRSEADSVYRVATKAALLKFEIARLLSEDKAIYLDGDIIVRQDLTTLYDVELDNCCAAVVRDIPQVLFEKPLIDTGSGRDYFNSGVMLLNLAYIREHGLRERLIDTKQTLHGDVLMDQNVFNLVFGTNVVQLPVIYNVLYANLVRSWRSRGVAVRLNDMYGTDYKTPQDILRNAVVIHYSSKDKPWKYFDAPAAREWMKYYKLSPCASRPLSRTCMLKERVLGKAGRIVKCFGERGWARLKLMFFCAVSYISPVWNTQLRFIEKTGKKINLKHPRTFSEKLSWLKIHCYAHDPLVKQCADKLRVREYVAEKGLGGMLNELIEVYECPEKINWETLPESFVLKWNFGSSYNIICRDKSRLVQSSVIKQLRRWRRRDFWLLYAERQYRVDKKVILCERFLETPEGEELLDYKFYCFHGKAKAVLVIARPENGEKAAVFMSPEWELISDVPSRYRASLVPERPKCLEEMVAAAERLSEPFPFVRVDFYQHEGRPVFGELTFTPAAGILPAETKIDGRTMGEMIALNISEMSK